MIIALSISDFALIRNLHLDAETGFTALTGQTGAGKSIILDALGIVLGMRPSKRFVRNGAKAATISVTLQVPPGHPVRKSLEQADLPIGPDNLLELKRIVPMSGSARSFINKRVVAAARLTEIGEQLVEISGQHAASNLLKPSFYRRTLDEFAGNEALLKQYANAWHAFQEARHIRQTLEARIVDVTEEQAYLQHLASELEALAPATGESAQLAAERNQRMQAERIASIVSEALQGLEQSKIDALLATSLTSLERVAELPEFGKEKGGELPHALHEALASLERANIELTEASASLHGLSRQTALDEAALERAEARLFALKAAGRKHGVDPDELGEVLETLRAKLALIKTGEEDLHNARTREKDAAARWRSAADKLSRARKIAAKRLQKAWQEELIPLKLADTSIRIEVTQRAEDCADIHGNDEISVSVETNPGAGFGPVQKIASGGELARFSLALKCAATSKRSALCTLIFDEADQGVGGAVAAAIGERLLGLAEHRQVFAVTHSPQVAAAAGTQWRIDKKGSKKTSKSLGQTRVRVLDAKTRKEEIARMLSGLKVTPEARAAATRLLEG